MENLKNCILHEIRNGFLLSLCAEINIKSMQTDDIKNIELAYKNFASNLENDIIKAIETFKKDNNK